MGEIARELSLLAGSWIITELSFAAPTSPPPTQVLKADATRWSIVFSSNNTGGTGGGCWISTRPNFSVTNGGILVPAQGVPQQFTYRDHGGLVQQAWYLMGGGATNNLGIIVVQVNTAGEE